MNEFSIPKGSTFNWGAPAKAMSDERSNAVAQAVAATPGVEEAYLPQRYAAGFVDPPAQVLVIVLARGAEPASVMPSLGAAISRIFPPGEYLDILPSLDDGTLRTIRQTGTQIYARTAPQSQSWWKRVFSRSYEQA